MNLKRILKIKLTHVNQPNRPLKTKQTPKTKKLNQNENV